MINDDTLEITIDAPKAYFLSKLTYPTASSLDRQRGTRRHLPSKALSGLVTHGTGHSSSMNGRRRAIELSPNTNFYLDPITIVAKVTYILSGGVHW